MTCQRISQSFLDMLLCFWTARNSDDLSHIHHYMSSSANQEARAQVFELFHGDTYSLHQTISVCVTSKTLPSSFFRDVFMVFSFLSTRKKLLGDSCFGRKSHMMVDKFLACEMLSRTCFYDPWPECSDSFRFSPPSTLTVRHFDRWQTCTFFCWMHSTEM